MGFGIWFKMWWMSFFRLLTCGSKPRKSERQRKKERERRLKAKYSSSARYRIKKQRKRRRSSHNAANLRTIRAVFGFLATTFSIVLLPFGLFHWGYKSAQVRRRTNASKTANTRSSSSNKNHNTANRSSKGKTTATTNSTWSTDHRPTASTQRKTNNVTKTHEASAHVGDTTELKDTTPIYSYSREESHAEQKVYTAPAEPVITEPVENTPKSTPKNEKDQYIRKRMIVAGSSYCDKAVLDQLVVGSYIELVPEPTNEHDKDAIMLTFNGEKIGYIAKKDLVPFSVCLKLKRNIYGIITAIIDDEYPTKYEYETWFNSERT